MISVHWLRFIVFENLECWQACRELRRFVARELVPVLPADERFCYAHQILRSARSTTAVWIIFNHGWHGWARMLVHEWRLPYRYPSPQFQTYPASDQTRLQLKPSILFIRASPCHPWLNFFREFYRPIHPLGDLGSLATIHRF